MKAFSRIQHVALAACLVLPLSPGEGHATGVPFARTEEREDCSNFQRRRQPLFGETHLHTGRSFDARVRLDLNTPRDAYDFAQGSPITLPDEQGFQSRVLQIDRPLDWAVVTDHSEFFAEMSICEPLGPTAPRTGQGAVPGTFSQDCNLLTLFNVEPGTPGLAGFSTAAGTPTILHAIIARNRMSQQPICTDPDSPADCDAAELRTWDEMQQAAEEAYDRSSHCRFTSFVGYEWTATPSGFNLHRNVIFRNANVPPRPVSVIDSDSVPNTDPTTIPAGQTGTGPDVRILWRKLTESCLKGTPGCEVMTIPHNSNAGGGLAPPVAPVEVPGMSIFETPQSREEAAMSRRFQPLVEIYQHKGASECRFDPRTGTGTDTSDELCAFEQLNSNNLLSAVGVGATAFLPPENFPPRSFVRNVLKEGMLFEQKLGVNPWKMGMIGSTDTHNALAGYTPEDLDFKGHIGVLDAIPVTGNNIENSSGGLAVVWAEENSRDSIWEALQRKETYGTSGTRPVVRFFGGFRFRPDECKRDFVRRGYRRGVPMGGDLPKRRRKASPSFIVAASMDDFIGTPLQRIQIVKGWVDRTGEQHERVFDVAGDPDNGATVSETCEPEGSGFSSLCEVWEDPEFDPGVPAFYYSRVVENPVCRYSTHWCQELGVNPLLPLDECRDQLDSLATTDPAAFAAAQRCCLDPATDIVQPVIQERAWTSPIWYTP